MTSYPFEDVRAALGSATEPTVVPLAGREVRVLPPMDWRQSAMKALNVGDFETWARKVLVNDVVKKGRVTTGSDDFATWLDVDPTYRQIIGFIASYKEIAGQDPGK